MTYVHGWNIAFGAYLVILFVILFIIGAYNCKIFSSYKKEGEVATLTSAVSVLVLTFFNIAISTHTLYSSHLPRIQTLIVLYCDTLSIYCIFILTFTYLPKVSCTDIMHDVNIIPGSVYIIIIRIKNWMINVVVQLVNSYYILLWVHCEYVNKFEYW